MTFQVDGALYPDCDPPARLETLAERAEFVERLCAAWDFGRLPERETIEEVRRPAWREAVDLARLLTSPAYHLLREWHGLPELPFLGSIPAAFRDDPNLDFI